MKILILNWRDLMHPKSGGAEIVTMEHARSWAKKGHQVTWLTSRYEGTKREEIVDGVHILRRSGSLFIYPYGFFYTLFRGHTYDVIVDEIHALAFCTPLATRTPIVAFIHEVAGEIWDYMASFPLSVIGKMLERIYFLFYRKTQFWTDAPSTIEELVALGISRGLCTAIPCPISSPVVVSEKKEKDPTFLFVSRVVPMKGIEEVLRAFSLITKEIPTAQLWIMGGGEESYIRHLQDEIKQLGIQKNVTFFGKVSQAEKYKRMARAHLLLHASVKEGWGLVVLEAASVSTPSIVYNVPGLRDVVHDGETGKVLSHNTPQEMAREALHLLNTKKYETYQRNGVAWVNSLRWDDVTNESLRLLQKTAVT